MTSQLSLMEAFVEDMLNLSQMRNGCFTLVQDLFNPQEALNFIKQIFLPKADAKQVTISLEIGILPSSLFGDQRRFKQVLINLVKNSLKFCEADDLIEVKACFDFGNVMMNVSVRDTGIGIDREDMPKLFT